MDRDALVNFFTTESPAFAARLRGVSSLEVQRVERDLGVNLPTTYREFLLLMGRDSGGLLLLGPGQNHNFDALLEQLPSETYPGGRYFKIAFPQGDSEISPPDYFLDLARSDGEDAPIVSFEDTEVFRPEFVTDMGFTFGEWLAHSLFKFLVLDHFRERSTVAIGNLTTVVGDASRNDVVNLLETMNFALVLPALERVSCFRRHDAGALIDVLMDGRGIGITLGSDDGNALTVVVDQLLLRFPHAAISGRGGPLGS